jgi:hypothetical protein
VVNLNPSSSTLATTSNAVPTTPNSTSTITASIPTTPSTIAPSTPTANLGPLNLTPAPTPTKHLNEKITASNLVPVPMFQHYSPAETMEEYNLWSYHKKRMIEWRRAKAIAKYVKDKAKITDLTTKAVILWLRTNGHHPLPPSPTHLVVTPTTITKPGKADMSVPATPIPSTPLMPDLSPESSIKIKEEPGLNSSENTTSGLSSSTPKSPSKAKRKQAANSQSSANTTQPKPKAKKSKPVKPAAVAKAPKKRAVKCEFCQHQHAPEEDCHLEEASNESNKTEDDPIGEEELESGEALSSHFLESNPSTSTAAHPTFFEKDEEEIDILGDFDSGLLY